MKYTIQPEPDFDGIVIYTKVLSENGERLYMDDQDSEEEYNKLTAVLNIVPEVIDIDTGVMENTTLVFSDDDEKCITSIVKYMTNAGYTQITPA